MGYLDVSNSPVILTGAMLGLDYSMDKNRDLQKSTPHPHDE
ncbi:MAG TPA: hypothetical protein VMW72_01245 [Sedimentisphaerales bacterium]|nr:hypothetical protein [Sedimentisphaerales bacterium]